MNNCNCLLFSFIIYLLLINIIFCLIIASDLGDNNCRVAAFVSFARVPVHNTNTVSTFRRKANFLLSRAEILCFFSNLIHFHFSFLHLQFFSTCFGPAGPSSGESNYTCSLWHHSLIRCYLVRGRWC